MRPFNITYRASPVRRPAIFAHIQKTAGTTIIEASDGITGTGSLRTEITSSMTRQA